MGISGIDAHWLYTFAHRKYCKMIIENLEKYYQWIPIDIEKIWEEHINMKKKDFISLASFENKSDFLICNLQDNKYYLKFDQVVFSQ